MTLLLTVLAAAVTTLLWYISESARGLSIGTLALMYWGASLMWLADAIAGYFEQGAAYFTPAASEMLNDAFLGGAVLVLGLVIWMVLLLVRDPKGVIRKMFRHDGV